MHFPKAWVLRWGWPLLMMALIFFASATPGGDLPDFAGWDFLVKKGGHTFGYALLGASYLHALTNSKRINRLTLLLAVILAGLFAFTDEFYQSFTPERSPSAADVGIDIIGAILGVGIWAWLRSPMRRQSTAPRA